MLINNSRNYQAISKNLSTQKELAIEPRPIGVKKLAGEESLYRIRVGGYRVIYQIFDNILLVNVIKVKHRREVYRNES
ncbi:MAG: type II toxin-antitoxin system RelE/ParE family toxin [Nostoc sp.]|uniref:type II toxin-antitoxin system RelE family toxin n=1 Tax=Nostoc sp. TaxID=1180 RepID=UPI002FF95141